jgi:adenylylsulfate kinase
MLGTGKTTLAAYLAARLRQVGRNVEVLDEKDLGDELWKGIGDTKEDRNLVVRRLGYVANVLSRNDVAVLVAAVSPYKGPREENRRIIGRYVEVYVDCPTEKLIQRDNTGKYKKALSGEIPNFIGITEPYEPPNSPEVTIHSDTEPVEEGARKIFQALLDLSLVTAEDLKVITGKRMKANPIVKKARRSAVPAKGERKAHPAARAAHVVKKAAGKSKGR